MQNYRGTRVSGNTFGFLNYRSLGYYVSLVLAGTLLFFSPMPSAQAQKHQDPVQPSESAWYRIRARLHSLDALVSLLKEADALAKDRSVRSELSQAVETVLRARKITARQNGPLASLSDHDTKEVAQEMQTARSLLRCLDDYQRGESPGFRKKISDALSYTQDNDFSPAVTQDVLPKRKETTTTQQPEVASSTEGYRRSTTVDVGGYICPTYIDPIFHPETMSILEALELDRANFSTLIGLLKKANLKELSEAKASYTLLAPTNDAFTKLPAENLTKLTNDPEKLRGLLLAHLLPGKVLFNTMFAPGKDGVAKKNVTESLKTADGGLAYFQCDEHPADPANKHHPLINKNARVLKSDIEGTDAVIQVIDAVLIPEKLGYIREFRPIFHPPTISILEALQQDPDNFSTLIGLIMKADLRELREAKASYTLLAPTNGAFAKLSPEYFAEISKDPEKLRQLLLAHLLPGKVVFNQLFAPDKDGVAKKNVTESLKTADGGLAYFLCDAHPADPANQHHPLINKNARAVSSDIEGTYSVIHVIDTVLIP